MVTPKFWLVLGISTCDTSPSNTGKRVMPAKDGMAVKQKAR